MKPRVKPVRRDNLPSRFTKEFLELRSSPAESGCVVWTNSLNGAGYAQMGEWPYNAHVLSFVLYKEDLEEFELVRHLCHNRACINPDHLEKGSDKDNWLDSEALHREAHSRRRGRPSHNQIRVVVDGQIFSSKVEAMKTLKRGPKYIKKYGVELKSDLG